MHELFIYYRVHMDLTATAHDLAQAFQARLRTRHPGLGARLLKRTDTDSGVATWMEHYAADAALLPHGIDDALRAEIEAEAAPLMPCIAGQRHTEAFAACAS